MIDDYGRRITYLRVSVTDRCNFRCTYCMPEEGIKPISHKDVLRYEEILRVARLAVLMGVTSIRITGGEPLVRKGIVEFVRVLSGLRQHGLMDLTMTTNGSMLEQHAGALKDAGLDRVNVSIDTLDPDMFRAVTRAGHLDSTLRGIGAAIGVGLSPVKLNVVATQNGNFAEVLDFAYLASQIPVQLRFIELMPLGHANCLPSEFVSSKQISAVLSASGILTPAPGSPRGAGPARYYDWQPESTLHRGQNTTAAADMIREAACRAMRDAAREVAAGHAPPDLRADSAAARIGFITALSEHFCPTCSRLRITSDGKLNPCLWSAQEIDVRTLLRSGASDDDIQGLLESAACAKPADYKTASAETGKRRMSRLGG